MPNSGACRPHYSAPVADPALWAAPGWSDVGRHEKNEPGGAAGARVMSDTAATLVGVKVSEILRLIGKDGWYLDRQRGSHRQYKHPSKRGLVTVSGKPSDDLHPRTRDSILRQAGLNEDRSQAEARRGES